MEPGNRLGQGARRRGSRPRSALDAEQQYRFLSAASQELASSLDYEATLAGIAARPLPYVGDWCIVDLVEPDERLRRVAIVHPEPAKRPLVEQLLSGWPPSREDPFGVPRVARSGVPELVPEVTEELLERVAQNRENLRLLRELGVGSLATVPLNARGELLGAITYVAATGRTLSTADINLALDLAALSALAVVNARLHESAEAARTEANARRLEAERFAALAGRLTERLLVSAVDEMEKGERAQATEAAKAEFLTSLSHELRTPLSAIGGYTELLLGGHLGTVTEKQAASLERVRMAVQQLLQLIEQILTFARLGAEREAVRLASVDLRAVAGDAADLLESMAALKGLALVRQIPTEPLILTTDGDKVRQILLNLLSNAIRFTSEGEVRLEALPQEQGVWFRVSDTGPGISARDQERIFERFFQADKESGYRGGSGLGLAITRALVRLLDGEITVQSELDRGTTFDVYLPSLERPADTAGAGT